MTTHQDQEERSPAQERLSRREALKDAAKLGLLLYCVPQVLSSEAVLAQSSPSTATTGGGGGDGFSALPFLGAIPLIGAGLLGGGGAAAAVAGVAPPLVPTTFLGIPLANTNVAPFIGRADTPLLDPTRGRGTLPPRPFNRVRRNRVGGGSQTRDNRVKRAIRGLG